MRWAELKGSEWTIPKERTKNGKEHLVHLSEQALAVLPPRSKSKLVFSTTGDTPISGYSKAKARLDELMLGYLAGNEADALELMMDDVSLSPWRTHDLRRTCASGMARIGIEPHVIERILNHLSGEQGGLQGIYQQYEYLPERKLALEKWGVALALIVDF
jgi:integrase